MSYHVARPLMLLLALWSVATWASPTTCAGPARSRTTRKAPAPLLLAQGTPVVLRATAEINSRQFKSGDPVRLQAVQGVSVQGVRLIAAGASAQGSVVFARGGRIGQTGSLVVSVDSVQAVDGTWIPLRATPRPAGGADGVLPARLIALGTAEFPNAKDAMLATSTTIQAWVDRDRAFQVTSGRPTSVSPSPRGPGRNALHVTAGLRLTVAPAREISGDNVMVGDHPPLTVTDLVESDGAVIVSAGAPARGTVVAAGPAPANGPPEELVLTVDAVQAANGSWLPVRWAGATRDSRSPNPVVAMAGVLAHGKQIPADTRVSVELRDGGLVLPPSAPAVAGTAPRANRLPFVPVWIGKQDSLTDQARDEALYQLAKQEPDPQQIFLLLHGWLNDRASSTASYVPVAENLRKLCQARAQRAAVVGLQWDSYSGRTNTFVPQILASTIGAAKNPYVEKARFARRVGRHAVRQLIIAMKERFPKARVHVLAHSMGCEAMGHVLATRLHEKEDPAPAFQADRRLDLGVVCLAGSDLDSSFIYNSNINEQSLPYLPGLTWITVPRLFQGHQDNVLALHTIARGQAAMGNTLPKMKEEQLDLLIGGRRLYYDNAQIPPEHDWPLYYTKERLTRLVDATLHTQDPARYPSADLETLEKVAAMEDNPELLSRQLDVDSMAVRLLVLYRLERLLCGGEPRHLADGSIAKLAGQMSKNPEAAQKACAKHPCSVVQKGWFPTRKMWDQARAEVDRKKH